MGIRQLSGLIASVTLVSAVCTSLAIAADPYADRDPKLRAELQNRLDEFAKDFASHMPAAQFADEAVTDNFISFGGVPKAVALDKARFIGQTDEYLKTLSSCSFKIVGEVIASGNLAVTVTREECVITATGQPDHYRSLFVWEKIGGKWKIARQGESEGPM